MTFIMALIGAPASLIAALLNRDPVWLISTGFWLVVGALLYVYLAGAARYWREHDAMRSEEYRRRGRTSFG